MKISELPKEYQELIPPENNRTDPKTDNIDFAFRWMETFPGGNFWSSCYFALSKNELPKIPERKKDGFHIIQTGDTNCAEFVRDGFNISRLKFTKGKMTNCGMCLFHNFGFPYDIDPNQYKDRLYEFYTKACENYPYALATHNDLRDNWFVGWEKIDNFVNPNSGNNVNIWKFKNKTYQ